jgi:hypothetical protein
VVGAILERHHTFRKDKSLMRTKQQHTFSEDKTAWHAAKQERLTDLGEQLKQEVAAVQDSESFKRYLAAQAAFHRYSARNVFLILYQRPEATRVAGYTTWQKLGRQVRRDETGITIFAPSPFKQTATNADTGEVSEEFIPRFKTATVFDIAQTVGELVPTITLGEIVGSALAGAYALLVEFAASIGYALVPHPEDDEAEGRLQLRAAHDQCSVCSS